MIGHMDFDIFITYCLNAIKKEYYNTPINVKRMILEMSMYIALEIILFILYLT